MFETNTADVTIVAPASDIKPADVRTWARANGIEVGARGRIAADVVDKFKAANGR